jgi:magnesium transporter
MLVYCVAYQDGRKIADIAVDDIDKYVRRPETLVWVALRDPEPEELEAMRREFGLHELAVEDARHGHQLPKVEEYGDSLFAVLHTVDVEDGELATGEVAIFVGANYVLSVRRGSRQGFVLYALMDAVVDRYFPVIEALETELEEAEEHIFERGAARAAIEALYRLKRKILRLQRAVRPLLEAAGKLYGGRVPPACVGVQEYLRDVADHLVRIDQSVEGLRETASSAMSVNLSFISLQENETTKRLAAYAALVAVPAFIAGLYGMNFENMPGLKASYGFPLTLSAMAVIDVYLFRRLRRAGWL